MRVDAIVRYLATPLLSLYFKEDNRAASAIRESYLRGNCELAKTTPIESWRSLENKLPGFKLQQWSEDNEKGVTLSPFVYESPNAPHLVELRKQFEIEKLLEDVSDEYEAMLRLGGWLGSRWDHGSDRHKLPRSESPFEVVDIIKAGEGGAKYWCEIASKVMVHAAAAMGWPARLVTTSRDGHTWEHAVAELWSNRFNKWFVIDTDFNIVYEASGVPLSAYELCHEGIELQDSRLLKIRAVAPRKPGINSIDMIPFYNYIHVDLRNDWLSRKLAPGSPAGGDYATWWTARDGFASLLTRKVRQDNPQLFNWAVNSTKIYVEDSRFVSGKHCFDLRLIGYSPYFEFFEYSLDEKNWTKNMTSNISAQMESGQHSIKARVSTLMDQKGPTSEIAFELG